MSPLIQAPGSGAMRRRRQGRSWYRGHVGLGENPLGRVLLHQQIVLGTKYLFEKSEYRNTFVSGYTEEL
jgi:hypothetical protein